MLSERDNQLHHVPPFWPFHLSFLYCRNIFPASLATGNLTPPSLLEPEVSLSPLTLNSISSRSARLWTRSRDPMLPWQSDVPLPTSLPHGQIHFYRPHMNVDVVWNHNTSYSLLNLRHWAAAWPYLRHYSSLNTSPLFGLETTAPVAGTKARARGPPRAVIHFQRIPSVELISVTLVLRFDVANAGAIRRTRFLYLDSVLKHPVRPATSPVIAYLTLPG